MDVNLDELRQELLDSLPEVSGEYLTGFEDGIDSLINAITLEVLEARLLQ